MCYIIFYIILCTIATCYGNSCPVSFNNTVCVYTVVCTDYMDSNLEVSRFTHPPYFEYIPNDELCHEGIVYGEYRVLPVKLIFEQNIMESQPVPVVFRYEQFLDIVYSLDISDNGYIKMPIIRSMQTLAFLNVSSNHLTTAVLANANDLNSLKEIDLSYNTINDIKVNSNNPNTLNDIQLTYPYKKLTKIDISHNYLVKIPNAIFEEFSDLQTLDLSYNYIDILNQFTFEGIKKLSDLNLSNNRLTGINASFFRFSELRILDLSSNRIQEVKLNDVEQLVNLEKLNLNSNAIKIINLNVFNTLVSLKTLYLSNNRLEVISKSTFVTLQSLKTIDLSKNKLKSLPQGLFKNATVGFFSITDNILEGALAQGMFEGINVTELDLSNQHLAVVQDYAFKDLTGLEKLLLHTNAIQSLSEMCFRTLVGLRQLDLSNNQITDIGFNKQDLSNLKSLLLKNNRISEIQQEQLQRLHNLEFLDISENQISQLEPASFQSLRNLINLQVNSNPLAGTLESGTFDGLVLLPSLDISRNKLTMIQNASFSDMSKLKELNMSGCEISELQYNVFVHTGYIESLDLSHNKLKDFFINTTELVGLSTLFLNNNLIKTLTSSSLFGLNHIIKLVLSHNAIVSMHNQSFYSLEELRYLDLSYNENLNLTPTMLKTSKDLHNLNLSGIKTFINFTQFKENPITDLAISNASIRNISELNLNGITQLEVLKLSYNKISRLQIGDFAGLDALRHLDLSFNEVSFIQPGVFKDNTLLNTLNVSHNSLSTIGYGIFRGLMYLSTLDMSYNNIKDLQSESFYEVKSLSQLIVDHNNIYTFNTEEFAGTTLSKLSIGDNPLPCQLLVKLKKNPIPFEITAMRIDEHSNENVNGVTCNTERDRETAIIPNKLVNNSDIFNWLKNILDNFTKRNAEENSNFQYLEKIANILEKSNTIYYEKLSILANLTSKVVAINNSTNVLLNKMMKSVDKNSMVTAKPTLVTTIGAVVPTTTQVPRNYIPTDKEVISTSNPKSYGWKFNDTLDYIRYVNNIKKELENAMAIEKQNIINEIESKLALNNYQTESLPTNVGHEKLVSNNESTKSLFTETCVGLILLILVGLVLYKFYKSRMFIRNRFSFSTHELPGAMENSAL